MTSNQEQRLADVNGLVEAAEKALEGACINRPDLIDYYTGIRNEWRGLAKEIAGQSS